MSLGRFVKPKGEPRVPEGTFKPLLAMEKIYRAYAEGYAVSKLGFVPISVWCTKKTKKWWKLLGEYLKIVDEVRARFDKKILGTAAMEAIGVKTKFTAKYSVRVPEVDERVYRFWGKPGYVTYNPFTDQGIEYLIAASLGMHYWGSSIDEPLLEANRRFAERHRHLIPEGIEVQFWFEDATVMASVDDNSVDLIWGSPPYWCMEVYPSDHPSEMSRAETYDDFLELYRRCARQMYRVLKPNRYAVIQVGDFRHGGKFYTLHVDTIDIFRRAGFALHDIVVVVYIMIWPVLRAHDALRTKYTVKSHEYLVTFKKV